ncbi:MAG: hypothetical protein ABTQ25_05180, partial [Nitrosomonas ureae]
HSTNSIYCVHNRVNSTVLAPHPQLPRCPTHHDLIKIQPYYNKLEVVGKRVPYTPERNPTEYLNRDFKTHLRLSARSSTPHALRQKANAFLQFLINTPERIMAYFNHPAVQYAAESPISLPG